MSWSLKVGRVFGIPIYIHWTFLLLIAWLILGSWVQGHDLGRTAEGVGFVLAIFGCVVLHELGHALTARRFGVPTADITLLIIGGIARLQRIPERPRQELLIALAGPAVNGVIVAALLLMGVSPQYPSGQANDWVNVNFWTGLLNFNIFLAVFNLLPAFPMDGGRVLRALLAMGMDYTRATRKAASIGQFMAILFAFLGLMNPILLLIALFVWIGAEAEARQVEERAALQDVTVHDAMLTEFHTLSPNDTLGHAADLLLAGAQQDFPVVVDGRPSGVLTRDGLLHGLAQGGRAMRVADARLAELSQIEVDAPLIPAVAQLRERGEPCLLVVRDHQPAGLLTLENIGEYLMVHTALAGSPQGNGMKTVGIATPPFDRA